jgi:hypothetical protein
MAHVDERLTKRETLPVADADGKLLGSCTIRKFTRQGGKAYNEIVLFDSGQHAVAEISGYRLHSRVSCGQRAGNSKRVDSKDAVTVARAALELADDPEHMLLAIQEIAETLADERRSKRRRSRSV